MILYSLLPLQEFLRVLDSFKDAHSVDIIRVVALEGCAHFFPSDMLWKVVPDGHAYAFKKVQKDCCVI